MSITHHRLKIDEQSKIFIDHLDQRAFNQGYDDY